MQHRKQLHIVQLASCNLAARMRKNVSWGWSAKEREEGEVVKESRVKAPEIKRWRTKQGVVQRKVTELETFPLQKERRDM